MRVVCIMSTAPILEGNGTQKTGNITNNIIPSPGFEKGFVSAIMLDNKDTHQKQSSNACQGLW